MAQHNHSEEESECSRRGAVPWPVDKQSPDQPIQVSIAIIITIIHTNNSNSYGYTGIYRLAQKNIL